MHKPNSAQALYNYNMAAKENNNPHIGTLNERSLHAALKKHLTHKGDQVEVKLENYVIDLMRGETLIEIQTRGFAAIRRKLEYLVPKYKIKLYHPIAARKWIVRVDSDGNFLKRRRSPRKGSPFDVFNELLSLRSVALHPNLELHILMIEVEEVWKDDGKGSWRKKFWSVHDHHLLKVTEDYCLCSAEDYLALLPEKLPEKFTNADLIVTQRCTSRMAGKATYSLREMGLIEQIGIQNRYHVFQRVK